MHSVFWQTALHCLYTIMHCSCSVSCFVDVDDMQAGAHDRHYHHHHSMLFVTLVGTTCVIACTLVFGMMRTTTEEGMLAMHKTMNHRPPAEALPSSSMSPSSLFEQEFIAGVRGFLQRHRCKKLYLDMGTNIGVQIRKLYEPQCYPNARALAQFNRSFGTEVGNHADVCAIGFEPNPHHTYRLKDVEGYLAIKKGFPVRIFTEMAIGARNGMASFMFDNWIKKHEWSSRIIMNSDSQQEKRTITQQVQMIDYATLLEAVSKVTIVLAKMDIEGSEYQAIASAVAQGVFCRAGTVMMEQHPHFASPQERPPDSFIESINFLARQMGKNCTTQFISMDDETYMHDNMRQCPID